MAGFPVTGSFSRTAVNSQSGVKTPLGGKVAFPFEIHDILSKSVNWLVYTPSEIQYFVQMIV